MTSYSIHFNNTDPEKIKAFLAFVQSLDIVQSMEPLYNVADLTEKSIVAELSSDYLTKTELIQQYPNEWILLKEPVSDGAELIGGKVLLHDKDKGKLAHKAQHIQLPNSPKRVFYTGTLPKNSKVGLMRKITP
jgi:hypothetical protein